MARKPKAAKPATDKGLSPRQEAFARAYVETLSGAEAYRMSYNVKPGTKDSSIHVNASKLLADAKVAQRVAELQEAVAKRHDITMDKIVRELALLGFSNMKDYIQIASDGSAYVDLSALTRDQAAAIGEVTSEVYMDGAGEDAKAVKRTKFKLADKRAALVDLGKHLGMFVDRRETKTEVVHTLAPQPTGDDHLEDITKRYALKTVELLASKPNGHLNGKANGTKH